jgi:seryl-tRNA synthetase
VLDLRLIRSDPDAVRSALARRQADGPLDELLALDERRRALQTEADALRAERNRASQAIGEAKRAGRDASTEQAAAARLGERLTALDAELTDAAASLDAVLVTLPNLPHESAADGMSEEDGDTVAIGGALPEFGFEPRDHLALAGPLIDTERAARTSGSRFAYLHGDLVRLHLALVQYSLAKLSNLGFLPTMPPVLVREPALYGTGIFPSDREQVYSLDPARDDLFLVGTSEVSLAALHMGEILDEDALPLRYAGISSCFRREAGAAGRDTRGIFRTHQFEKVEMFSFCHPDRSWDEHELILSIEREIADELGLHYRVVNIAVGDLGDSAAKKYDIEVWLPGQGRFRELTSCSNTTDYQARRLECRMRTERGTRVLHTLNGTAVTSSRTMIAVLETHQRADGSVAVPAVLQPFGAPATIGPPPDLTT